jgi:hypothetical protein
MFTVVHPLSKVVGKLVFGDGLDNLITACLEAVLGQGDASQFFTLGLGNKSTEAKSDIKGRWPIIFMALPPFEVLD